MTSLRRKKLLLKRHEEQEWQRILRENEAEDSLRVMEGRRINPALSLFQSIILKYANWKQRGGK